MPLQEVRRRRSLIARMSKRNQRMDQTKTIDPQLMTMNECAGMLNVSHWRVRDLIEKGRLPIVRLGRRVLIDRKDVDRLIEENKERFA